MFTTDRYNFFPLKYHICICLCSNKSKSLSFLLVSELFLELSSCLRLPTESNVEEQVEHRHVHPGMYSANQLVLTVENRDSMAFLAAVFTGNYLWGCI